MAGTRQTNTFGEQLQKLLRDFADMKVTPDADLPFIIDLETRVIGKLREPIDQAQPMSQVPGNPGLGMSIGMQGQAPSPMGKPAPGVPRGMTPSAPMPSPDELRRVLDATA